jgi:hypothetical protein
VTRLHERDAHYRLLGQRLLHRRLVNDARAARGRVRRAAVFAVGLAGATGRGVLQSVGERLRTHLFASKRQMKRVASTVAQARPISGKRPQYVQSCDVGSRSSTTLGSCELGRNLKSDGHCAQNGERKNRAAAPPKQRLCRGGGDVPPAATASTWARPLSAGA